MIKKKRGITIIYSLILIDLLVLPYLQTIIIPMSLLPVAWLFFTSKESVKHDPDFKIYVGITLCATLSTALSPLFLTDDRYIIDNIKYLFQLVASFFYFFVFKWIAKNSEVDLKLITIPIYVFLGWYGALVIFYFSDPTISVEFIKDIYGRTSVQYDDFFNDMRFPYLFSDPNTAIYFYLLSASYLNFLRPTLMNLIIFAVGGGLATIATQSTGGFFAYISILVLMLITNNKVKLWNLVLYAFSIFIFSVVAIGAVTELEYFQDLQTLSLDRLFSEDRYSGGGGRIYHWTNVLSLYPLPLGRGYILFSDGVLLPPHSDLLGTVYRYGFLSTILFIYMLFLRGKRLTVFSIAVIIPFAINALLEDQKLFALYLIFIGYASGVKEKTREYALQHTNK